MITALVLTIRFLTELVLIGAVAIGAARLIDGWPRLLLAAISVAFVVGIWGRFIGPRAPTRLPDPTRLVTEVALFTWGAAGLVIAGWTPVAILFAVVAVSMALAVRVTGEPVPHGAEP